MNKRIKKILKSIVLAAAGAALFQVATDAQNYDWGSYTPYIVAGCTVLVNILRQAGMAGYEAVKKPK